MIEFPVKAGNRAPALNAGEYRDIFDALEQGYCIFEMLLDEAGRPCDYRFLEINSTFERQTGLVNPVGRTALELVPDLEPHWVETYGRVAETGESVRFVQGSEAMGRWFSVLATRVGPPERRLVALLFNDITAHREEQEERRKAEAALRQSEQRLDLAVTSGEVGLWYCDLPFDKLVWNAKVKEHFGLPPDAEVTIDTFYERMLPEDRERTRQAIDTSIAGRTSYDTQYRTVGMDGRIRWIRAIGHTAYDGDRPVRFDGITVDITELMTLRESAEAASRAKDEFLAMLGHELRNPLAPILTALQLLKLRGIEAGEHERGIIERQVRHLVGLVDDLLDVSRITRGRVELRREPIELSDVVARAVEIASPLLEQQRHVLTLDVPRGLVVSGDIGRLSQVVANLLSNAAKYTDAGGTVTVRGLGDAEAIELAVADSGVGIDAPMLARVFDLFAQEPQSLARSQGGLGLGLAIVRSLVELHGGTVRASSRGKGQGAVFSIRLPRADAGALPAAETASEGSTPSRRAAAGTRVLVVDDNQDAARLLGSMLTACGYDTHVVYDAPSAVTDALALLPDIALVDIGLPVMDGYELARRFAEHSQLRAMKLIAVTGYGQTRDQSASKDAGFAAHLVKPVDLDDLHAVLSTLSR